MKIRLENINKWYQKRQVLTDVSFQLEEGRIYGVAGDNGSGKTTLFRIIAGLEKPTDGTIFYDERKWKMDHQEMTYMHQKPYMMKASVEENIAYPLEIRGYSQSVIRESVRQYIDELGLATIAKQQARMVSGGEAQKIALARAMIFVPKVLLMDEPTANLDQDTRENILRLLQRRRDVKELTTVMITHDYEKTKDFFDGMIYLDKGGRVCIQ